MLRSAAVRTVAAQHARQTNAKLPNGHQVSPGGRLRPARGALAAQSQMSKHTPTATSSLKIRPEQDRALASPIRARASAALHQDQKGEVAGGQTDPKYVKVRPVKHPSLGQVFYTRLFGPSTFQCQSPYFRLRVFQDRGSSLSASPPLADPHAVPAWLPQPAHRSTHKRRHLRMLTARLLQLKERGTLDESEMEKVSGYHIDDPETWGTSSRMVVTERLEKQNEDEDTFSVFKTSSTAWPPLPWTARQVEMRVLFINSKKETHKHAVVRERCKRRIKVALQALFLPLSNKRGRAILGKDYGAQEFPPEELMKLVHTDRVYVFIARPISFTAPMLEIARALHQALIKSTSSSSDKKQRSAYGKNVKRPSNTWQN
ncbi:hypothetical protein OC846_002599 [Tilletia horrida]|uniref:Uncharacterized protein n=1 Tax=Tilletia horrida TaxID=155126 RepID=A0AAN6JRZ5_9BASI|nr:hypothetical protein OC845_002870 [Tilletia horrida]KAK0553227.1 hypothetical protein OC846_002599 [Tilletia horrida]KAK0565289.1 hypothetical protein OC861_003836 [Tilletia horrida]